MNGKLAEISRRKRGLMARADSQREVLAESYLHLRRPLYWLQGPLWIIQTLKSRPMLVMILVALLTSVRWKKADRLARWLWVGQGLLSGLRVPRLR